MKKGKQKISYVKKPFAPKSIVCILLSALALALAAVSLAISVSSQGQGGLEVAAWGVSSLLFSIASLVYGGASFLEPEMNYILSKIGIVASGILLVFWVSMLLVGIIMGHA